MTATNHALTGAVIALMIKQPAVALPLAFTSHYILDALPHFGWNRNIIKRNKSTLFWIVLVTDVILLLLSLIILPISVTIVSTTIVMLAMLLSVSPDFAWVYRFFRELKTHRHTEGNITSRVHRKIQWCERPWGIFVEIGWFTGMAILLIRLIR